MIHTIRTVTVDSKKSVIDSPIVLYRGDREVEIEFSLVGSKFTFSEGGNVIKSLNAAYGQLIIHSPNPNIDIVFSEITECNDGKVVFLITKEMIDELVEVGTYDFQIRLYDATQVSRATIPPISQALDIRHPMGSEEETNVVDIAIAEYSIVRDDPFEDVMTFLPSGDYNKTEWSSNALITAARMNKIEDGLYTVNRNMEVSDTSLFNRIEKVNNNLSARLNNLGDEIATEAMDSFSDQIAQLKGMVNASILASENKVAAELDAFEETINTELESTRNTVEETKATIDETQSVVTELIDETRETVSSFEGRINALDAAYKAADVEIQNESNRRFDTLTKTTVSNLRNTEGFINKIFEVCQSYTDNFDKLVYGNVYTAWDDEVKAVDGKYHLDCSSFINLLIHGVRFENSRYNGNDENYGDPLFFHGIDSYEYRLANQIAKYCVDNGYAYIPTSIDELQPGDIVFYSWKGYDTNPENYTDAQKEFHNNAFMKIDHVAMYLDAKNDIVYNTIQYEQYTPQFLYPTTEDYMNQMVLAARLPFANIQESDARDLIVNGNIERVCTNAVEIGKYHLCKKLEKGKMYSLTVKYKIETDLAYLIVQDSNYKTIYSDYGRQSMFDGVSVFNFLYQGEGDDTIYLAIGSGNTENLQRNGRVYWCSLHEGYKITPPTKMGNSTSNVRPLEITTSIKNIFLEGASQVFNIVEHDTYYMFNIDITVNQDYKSDGIAIGYIYDLKQIQNVPCTLISYNNTVTNGILEFNTDKYIRVKKFNTEATWRRVIASGIIIK